jgi:hypothetical protein
MQGGARPAGDDSRFGISAPAEKPAAMSDPSTYVATRLREIKADPANWDDVWTWRREFAAADTSELRREVTGLARQVGPDPLLAVLAQALACDDPLLRTDAARSIALLPENRMADGISIGVTASDADTRLEVMDVIEQVQPHLRPELLRASLVAGPVDVQMRAIDLLTDHPSPGYFAVLVDGLRSTSGEPRRAIEQAITTMTGQTLTDYDAAARWWTENHARYDGMMALVD